VVSESLRVLLALLLLLLVIVSLQLATPTYSSTRVASGGLDVKANVTCYAGISAVDEYIFGEAKILVVYLNPRVLYSYRNVHVVYEDWYITSCSSYFNEKYHRRVYIEHPRYGGYTLWLVDLLPRSLFNERLGALKEAFATLNLTVDYLEYVDMNSLFPEPIDPFGQGLILIDLEGKPINLVAKAIGIVFKDVNYTIVVYDKRLYDIYQLLRLDPAAKIIREARALILEELRPIYRDFVERAFEKEKCISGGGLLAASAGPLAGITGGFYIADIAIPTTYDALSESCKVAILEFIVKVSDIARKYIPEEIPLYISFIENHPPPEPLPLIPASGYASGGEPVNTPSGYNFTQLNDKPGDTVVKVLVHVMLVALLMSMYYKLRSKRE
jgi:hypothetical protein